MENHIYIIAAVVIFIIAYKVIVGIRNTFVRGKVKRDVDGFSKWCRDHKEELDQHFVEHEEEIHKQLMEERRKARGEE